MRKLEISEVSEFLILALILKSKTQKILCYVNLFYLRKLKISKVRNSHQKCPVKKVLQISQENTCVGKHQ